MEDKKELKKELKTLDYLCFECKFSDKKGIELIKDRFLELISSYCGVFQELGSNDYPCITEFLKRNT